MVNKGVLVKNSTTTRAWNHDQALDGIGMYFSNERGKGHLRSEKARVHLETVRNFFMKYLKSYARTRRDW